MVRQCVEYCAPTVIAIAKRGYFSSPSDIPVTTMLLTTLIPTNFSAVLLRVKCLYRSWTLLPLTQQATTGSLWEGWPHGQKRKKLCYPHRMLKKNLLTILPDIHTGFLLSLSDTGPNVIFPTSNPEKNREDSRLTL